MLAGLQRMPGFMPELNFENFVPGVAPSYDDILNGRDLVKYDKIPVRVKEYHTEVFDMMSEDDRNRYSSRMKELMEGVQTSKVVIWKNELSVIGEGNGKTGWKRYLEWSEYELNDPLLNRKRGLDVLNKKEDENKETVRGDGVLSELEEEDDG